MSKSYRSPEKYLADMIRDGYIRPTDILPPPPLPAINPEAMPGIGHPKPPSPIRKALRLGLMDSKHQTNQLGGTPCNKCSIHRHEQCRPRMDGTLCSCSCTIANHMRDSYMIEKELAEKELAEKKLAGEEGQTPLSVWDFAVKNGVPIFGRKLRRPKDAVA
jgi:hypothetical protein